MQISLANRRALITGGSKGLGLAMAKRFATDTGMSVVDRALQMFGGYGYLQDYPVEKLYRDLRVHQILEGTNEIMRVVIARELMRAAN